VFIFLIGFEIWMTLLFLHVAVPVIVIGFIYQAITGKEL